MKSLQRTLAAVTIAGAALAGIPASAELVSFNAKLQGGSEVPPNATAGIGTLTLSFNTVERKLSWKGSYSGLSGPVTAAHFHGPAAVGRNAGISLVIAADTLPAEFEGSATITDAQATDLMAGRWYVNLFTAANPAGEIRGQVLK